MPRFSLNLQSRQNVMLLTPLMHNLLNNEAWLLLPEDSIIQHFLDITTNRTLCENKTVSDLPVGPLFNYRFIAHPRRMKSVSIFRRNFPNVDHSSSRNTAPLSADDFTHYSYPFDGFPIITSHVHPRFVICNGGDKLRGDSYFWANGDKALDKSIMAINTLWGIWSRGANPRVLEEFKDFRRSADQQGPTYPSSAPHSSTTGPRRPRLALRNIRPAES